MSLFRFVNSPEENAFLCDEASDRAVVAEVVVYREYLDPTLSPAISIFRNGNSLSSNA